MRESDERGQFVTLPKAARFLGIGLDVLERAVDAGELIPYQFGDSPHVPRRFRWEQIERWVESCRVSE